MVFSSVIFLFFFLPLILVFYSLAGRRFRNIILLLASLVFYAWGEGFYLLIMLLSIAMNYCCGIFMLKKSFLRPGLVLAIGVTCNLLLLGFFKYANFIVDNVNVLFSAMGATPALLAPVHLPIGISFFTFQAISYIIDLYRRQVEPQTNIIDLGLYIALFPQLIAGPIVRYQTIASELHERKFHMKTFAYGVRRFIFGLSKKVLLANPLAEIADKVFALPGSDLSPSLAWLGAMCYTLQIYFDFSGYSDMAIGLGRMFGFHFLENFNYPYISKSIREFWRRWHISLSTWLRDYLYIPLGGNRHSTVRTYGNLLLVFFLCGLWHGASWTFVCWGLFHGFFLILERTGLGGWMDRWWYPLRHLWTMMVVMVGWVIFRCDTLDQAITHLQVMIGLGGEESGPLTVSMMLVSKAQIEIVIGLILAAPFYPLLKKGYLGIRQNASGRVVTTLDGLVYTTHFMVLALFCYLAVISLAAGVYNPFIYFRF